MPDPLPDLTPAEKQAVQEEEARAWANGREVLVAVGVTDFEAFEKRRRVGGAALIAWRRCDRQVGGKRLRLTLLLVLPFEVGTQILQRATGPWRGRDLVRVVLCHGSLSGAGL